MPRDDENPLNTKTIIIGILLPLFSTESAKFHKITYKLFNQYIQHS